MGGKTGTKAVYFDKLKGLLEEYKSIFIVRPRQKKSQARRIDNSSRSASTMSRRNRCTRSEATSEAKPSC